MHLKSKCLLSALLQSRNGLYHKQKNKKTIEYLIACFLRIAAAIGIRHKENESRRL